MKLTIQDLINSGMAWRLEGAVGRQCMAAIDNGAAILGKTSQRDYYGNRIPSRTEVKSGTKGSVRYANDLRARRGLDRLTGRQYDRGLGVTEGEWE
jgi:hypothetical protein